MRNYGIPSAPSKFDTVASMNRVRAYRRRNLPDRIRGVRAEIATHLFPRVGLPALVSSLSAVRINPDGTRDDLGIIGRRVITTVGVGAMANAFLGTFTLANFNYVDTGTGTNAESIADTTLQTPTGDPRSAGTQTSPSNGVYRNVSLVTYAGSFAVTEYGLFSASTVGTLLDRFKFAAINVVSGASIQFTFNLTFTAGG